jgi:hypothetical protein
VAAHKTTYARESAILLSPIKMTGHDIALVTDQQGASIDPCGGTMPARGKRLLIESATDAQRARLKNWLRF